MAWSILREIRGLGWSCIFGNSRRERCGSPVHNSLDAFPHTRQLDAFSDGTEGKAQGPWVLDVHLLVAEANGKLLRPGQSFLGLLSKTVQIHCVSLLSRSCESRATGRGVVGASVFGRAAIPEEASPVPKRANR